MEGMTAFSPSLLPAFRLGTSHYAGVNCASSPFFACPLRSQPTQLPSCSSPKKRHVRRRSSQNHVLPRSNTVPSMCAPSGELPSTTGTFVDPESGSKVYIVGCVHGSKISSDDVHTVLSEQDPDAVVLELCHPRLKTLRKILHKSNDKSLKVRLTGKSQKKEDKMNAFKKQFLQMIRTFQGVPQAILALTLDGAYKLQTVSGLKPGIEFSYPICEFPDNKIICGDNLASDTIDSLYKVFIMPMKSIQVSLRTVVLMLQRVAFPPSGGVQFLRIMTEPKRVKELSKLVLTASMAGFVVFTSLALFSYATEILTTLASSSTATTTAANATSAPSSGFQGLWGSLQMIQAFIESLISVYAFTSAIHFIKVLILDRDTVIAENIYNTVRHFETQKEGPVTICAVVGLLHVNGVVQSLNDQGWKPVENS